MYTGEICEFGLMSNARRDIPGIISFSNCKRFPIKSGAKLANPVMFPPGCAKLSTSLLPIGSGMNIKTNGIVLVVSFIVSAATVPAETKASTFIDTSSTAMLLKRSGISLGKRCSSTMLRPST
jgi:hypothetical protein